MIFVDASAIVAILNGEPESARFLAVLETHAPKLTSPIAIFEAAAAIMRERRVSPRDAADAIQTLLTEAEVGAAPITEPIGLAAIDAFSTFGKGRHPAKLNLGDCFTYALAKAHGAGLLFKGDDFVHTDLPAAV